MVVTVEQVLASVAVGVHRASSGQPEQVMTEGGSSSLLSRGARFTANASS